ncbi:MAG: hypothetical protein ACYTG2_11305 [Planctomycetota bacterium]|jgi:hypothetical protein
MTSKKQDCDLGRDSLHKTFDKEPSAPDVAGHVARCAPCSDALGALQTQRDAVQFLAGGEAGPATADRTAIEQILSATARTGREKLADLLYELAKACLIVLPDLERRIERKAEPREAPVVAGELRTINSRLDSSRSGVSLDGVPTQTPEEARALAAADACLRILANVEGNTERQQLAYSQVLGVGISECHARNPPPTGVRASCRLGKRRSRGVPERHRTAIQLGGRFGLAQ